MTGKFLYNVDFGPHTLVCEVYIKNQLDELSEVTGQVIRIYAQEGFEWIREGEFNNFETELLTELAEPNEALKEIL